MTEFLDTAFTNKENDPAELLRVFPGLMKRDAMHWFHNDVPVLIRQNWPQLQAEFLKTFRRDKSMSRILTKLRGIKMKRKDSVRRFGQRVRRLISKINPALSPEMQAEYFMGGLPKEMNKWVRHQDPTSITEAIRAAEKYVEVEEAQEDSSHGKKRIPARRKGKSRKPSDTTSDTSEDGSDIVSTSSSEEETSSSSNESSSDNFEQSGKRRNKMRRVRKKKISAPRQLNEFKKTIEELTGQFDKLNVNLAQARPKRKSVPLQRPGVWCSRCGKRGHYPMECEEKVQYINEELEETYVVQAEEEEVDWRFVANAGQFVPNPKPINRGIGRGTGPMGTKPVPKPPMEPPTGWPEPGSVKKGSCYNCGDPSHYSPSCPWPKNPYQVKMLCGNCGQSGHLPLECPNPAQPKLLVKYVKTQDQKESSEVRLIYIEEATMEESRVCDEVEFVDGEVYKTSTRSMKAKDFQELKDAMKQKKKGGILPLEGNKRRVFLRNWIPHMTATILNIIWETSRRKHRSC
jgi:hypothetical protein